MNEKRKRREKRSKNASFPLLKKKEEQAVTSQLFACHPFCHPATQFPSHFVPITQTQQRMTTNDVCQNDFRSPPRRRAKLERELNQQEAHQEELKGKQRGLQENEERIKRQIKVWKDLQVMPHLQVRPVRHALLISFFFLPFPSAVSA